MPLIQSADISGLLIRIERSLRGPLEKPISVYAETHTGLIFLPACSVLLKFGYEDDEGRLFRCQVLW